jgi:hypothetical protein
MITGSFSFLFFPFFLLLLRDWPYLEFSLFFIYFLFIFYKFIPHSHLVSLTVPPPTVPTAKKGLFKLYSEYGTKTIIPSQY